MSRDLTLTKDVEEFACAMFWHRARNDQAQETKILSRYRGKKKIFNVGRVNHQNMAR